MMKRLIVAIALAMICTAALADAHRPSGSSTQPMGTAQRICPVLMPVPKHSFAVSNEVWLVTNLVDDGTRTTISYRIATIESDGRVIATGRTGVFCVGSARAAQNSDFRIGQLEDDLENLSEQVRRKAEPPSIRPPRTGHNSNL